MVADRFKNELNPAITETDLASIRSNLNYDNIDNLEVNLISATLRVMINTSDDMAEGDLLWILNDAADKIAAVLPIETYFTNSAATKMYDLEIHVYNTTKGSETLPQIYYVKTKRLMRIGSLIIIPWPKIQNWQNQFLILILQIPILKM